MDASLITFCHARNILACIGYVYNPGEHVLDIMSPFYTFLLTHFGDFSNRYRAHFPYVDSYNHAIADSTLIYLCYKLTSPLIHLSRVFLSTFATSKLKVLNMVQRFPIHIISDSMLISAKKGKT